MADSLETKTTPEEDELSKLIKYVDEYIDATVESRALSEKCRDYFDGIQWTDSEVETLKNRNQPAITNNRIKPKVQFLRGMEMRTRTDPKAFPRNPEDEESAEVSTDALRYVSDNNRGEQKISKGFKSYLIEGTQGHEVVAVPKGQDFEIIHNVLEWDRLWYDPHSREEDFSDARYLGTLQWMDKDEGKETFPDADDSVWSVDSSSLDDTHEDRPLFFVDNNRDRVRVFFAYYIKQGVWHFAIFTKSGFIQKPAPSPYLDDDEQPEPQFVFHSAFVDRDGNRYGEVKNYLDLQDEINKRRSKMLHLISVRQTFGSKGAMGPNTPENIKKELAKPDGHVETVDGEFGKDFGVFPTTDMAVGQEKLLAEAKNEIDSAGANAALTGQEERNLSGRALQSLQQGNDVSLGPLFDGNKYCKNRIHRMEFNRIKQFWTAPKWVRVTDNEDKLKWTGLNQPVTLGETLLEKANEGGIEALAPEEIQMLQTQDPRLNTVVKIDNPVNELDVDIIIDESIDTVTLQHEQFELLAKLYEINPNAVPFELVIRASQLRNKDELVKLIAGGTEEQKAALQEQQQAEKQEADAIIKEAAISDIDKTRSETKENLATANKTEAETQQIAIGAAIDIHETVTPVQPQQRTL